jgi:ADP-heptose:LPS heptosyltransferase
MSNIVARVCNESRVLVVRLDGIGDCVLSSGFFIGLRERFPNSHITGVFRSNTAPLFEESGFFDKILRVTETGDEVADALTPPYDLAISPRWDIDYWTAENLILRSAAPIRVGFDRGPYRKQEWLDAPSQRFFTDLVRTDSAKHEVLKANDLLTFLDASADARVPRLFIPDPARVAALNFQHRFSHRRYAVLGISAGLANRVWPIENFLPMIDQMVGGTDLGYVVVGGEDAEAPGRWLSEMRPQLVASVAGQMTLMETAALIAEAALYIGMDSGPMHLAAASGVPVVEISCHPLGGSIDHHNSPARFGPFNTANRIVRPTKPAQPARPNEPCVDGCHRLDTSHCIALVTVEEVVGAAMSLLSDTGNAASEMD